MCFPRLFLQVQNRSRNPSSSLPAITGSVMYHSSDPELDVSLPGDGIRAEFHTWGTRIEKLAVWSFFLLSEISPDLRSCNVFKHKTELTPASGLLWAFLLPAQGKIPRSHHTLNTSRINTEISQQPFKQFKVLKTGVWPITLPELLYHKGKGVLGKMTVKWVNGCFACSQGYYRLKVGPCRK